MKKQGKILKEWKKFFAILLAFVLLVGDGSGLHVFAASDFEYDIAHGLSGDEISSDSWYHAVLGTPVLWDNGITGKGVEIAVLSTGCNGKTEGLEQAYGVVTYDPDGQGTAMCDIIGNQVGTGTGRVGIAHGATLYAYEVKQSGDANANSSDLTTEIYSATYEGADIICIGSGNFAKNTQLDEAIEFAYNRGVLIICAAGDNNSNTPGYPVGNKHVVAVAALNESMSKAPMSNYGSKIRYCAPGVGFLVADKTGTPVIGDADESTSYAAAIVAGQAALLWDLAEGDGSKKVDNVIKLMDKNAVRYGGGGMGKGMVSLQKAYKIGDTSKAPAKPTFSHKSGTYTNYFKLEITDGGELGNRIYYSNDGKPITVKNGRISENAILYDGGFTIYDKSDAFDRKGETVIHAVTYNTYSGLMSSNVKAAYQIKNYGYSQVVIRVKGDFSNPYKLIPGNKISLYAETWPFGISKPVTVKSWSIEPAEELLGYEEGMVTISRTGVVSARKDAIPGKYEVTAMSKEGREATAIINVTENANPIKRIVLDKSSYKILSDYDEMAKISGTVYLADNSKRPLMGSDLKWICSDTSIANIDTSDLMLKGIDPGSAKLYGYTLDGSNVKVTVNVTVQQSADYYTITGNHVMVPGTASSYKAVAYPSDAANKAVIWSIEQEGAKEAGISVSSNGKVSISKDCEWTEFTLKAVSTRGDAGKLASGSLNVEIKQRKSSFLTIDKKNIDIIRRNINEDNLYVEHIRVSCDTDNWSVSCNNQSLSVIKSGKDEVCVLAVPTYGSKYYASGGTAVITIQTTDGSNKKVTCKVNVKNPVTGLMIAPADGRGDEVSGKSSLQLKPYYVTECGKVAAKDKKITWSTDAPDKVRVSANGKVSLMNQNVEFPFSTTITAECPFGATASYRITFTEPTKTLTLNNDTYTGETMGVGDLEECFVKKNGVLNGDMGKTMQVAVNKEGLSVQKIAGGKKLRITAEKPGTYKLTIKAMDGSNIKKTYTFKVTE